MNDIIRKIHVNASLQYDILIGPGLLKSAGELVSQLNPGKHLVIVSDDNVYPIYGEMLKESLKEQGIETVKFVFPHGEHSKSMEVFEKLLEFMCENHITRSDMVAALGGGVTGDFVVPYSIVRMIPTAPSASKRSASQTIFASMVERFLLFSELNDIFSMM